VDTPLLRKLQKDNADFDWDGTVKPQEIAEFVGAIVAGAKSVPNGARVIVVSEALKEDWEYSEDVWGYNVTTDELIKLKQG
jgi:hypothetical protein